MDRPQTMPKLNREADGEVATMVLKPLWASAETPAFISADPALFNPQTGRLDAARTAHEIQLPVATIADAIGKKASNVRTHPDDSSLQPELRRVSRIWVAPNNLYGDNKKHARIFLNAPNRHLELQTSYRDHREW